MSQGEWRVAHRRDVPHSGSRGEKNNNKSVILLLKADRKKELPSVEIDNVRKTLLCGG